MSKWIYCTKLIRIQKRCKRTPFCTCQLDPFGCLWRTASFRARGGLPCVCVGRAPRCSHTRTLAHSSQSLPLRPRAALSRGWRPRLDPPRHHAHRRKLAARGHALVRRAVASPPMTELRRNHERHVEGAAARAVRAPKASLGISLSSQNARRPTRRPSSSAPRRSRSRSLLPAGSRCAVAPARAACLANGIARLLAHAVSHAARALRAILCFRGSRSLASTNPRLQPPGARDGRRDACAGGRERHVARGRSVAPLTPALACAAAAQAAAAPNKIASDHIIHPRPSFFLPDLSAQGQGIAHNLVCGVSVCIDTWGSLFPHRQR